MNKYIQVLVLCLFTVFFLSGCKNNKPIVIQQFYPFNKMADTSLDRGNVRTYKEEYFLVSNFKDDEKSLFSIDSFVYKHISAELLKFNTYVMVFYKESSRTNLKKISENPRELDRYSAEHDLIFDYIWLDAKFDGRLRIKDGERIYPGHKKLHFTMEPIYDSVKK